MKTRIGINGFGRIGRLVLRTIIENQYNHIEVAAVNSLGNADSNHHMFKYDSNYGPFKGPTHSSKNSFTVSGMEIACLTENHPSVIPWNEYGVEIVLECTGLYTDRISSSGHFKGGAKKVVISAPSSDPDITIVMGVNENNYNPSKHHIVSNGSCTTNCIAPVIKILDDNFGLEAGLMSTIHSYTNDQNILDKRHKDLRRARSAATNIIPTTTGAAKSIGSVIPHLDGKLHGMAFRIPTPAVSVVDLVATLGKTVNAEEINKTYSDASIGHMNGIVGFSAEPLVSSDFKGSSYSCIVDGLSTLVISESMVKVVAWYDNEWGYSNRIADLTDLIAEKGSV